MAQRFPGNGEGGIAFHVSITPTQVDSVLPILGSGSAPHGQKRAAERGIFPCVCDMAPKTRAPGAVWADLPLFLRSADR
jgi:hypothetical protein